MKKYAIVHTKTLYFNNRQIYTFKVYRVFLFRTIYIPKFEYHTYNYQDGQMKCKEFIKNKNGKLIKY